MRILFNLTGAQRRSVGKKQIQLSYEQLTNNLVNESTTPVLINMGDFNKIKLAIKNKRGARVSANSITHIADNIMDEDMDGEGFSLGKMFKTVGNVAKKSYKATANELKKKKTQGLMRDYAIRGATAYATGGASEIQRAQMEAEYKEAVRAQKAEQKAELAKAEYMAEQERLYYEQMGGSGLLDNPMLLGLAKSGLKAGVKLGTKKLSAMAQKKLAKSDNPLLKTLGKQGIKFAEQQALSQGNAQINKRTKKTTKKAKKGKGLMPLNGKGFLAIQ